MELADMALPTANRSRHLSTCPLCQGCGMCELLLAHLTSDAIARARDAAARQRQCTAPGPKAQPLRAGSRVGSRANRQRNPARNETANNPATRVTLPPLGRGRVQARASDSWPQQAIKDKKFNTSLPPISKSATKPQNCSFFVDFVDHKEEPSSTPGLPPISFTVKPLGRNDSKEKARATGEDTCALSPTVSASSAHAARRGLSSSRLASRTSSNRSPPAQDSDCEDRRNKGNPTGSNESEPLAHGMANEMYRQAMDHILTNNWDDVIDGLNTISRVLKFAPHVVNNGDEMPYLMRTVNLLVRSMRSRVAICACRTAYALFKRVDCTRRPAFDELVGGLLLRTGDKNKFVRHEALHALTAMAEYIPILNSVRALVEQGGRNKNDLVRAATAQMLDLVVECQGPAALMDSREIRQRLCPLVAAHLEDSHPDTRAFAKHTFAALSLDERFLRHFKALINTNQMFRMDKIIKKLH